MYKSSYAHFHSKVSFLFYAKDSVLPKNTSIPGYQGFVPQVRSESLYGKSSTVLTKEVLGETNYGKTMNGLSTNGFNTKMQDHIDQSKTGSTSKYGRSAWLQAHPAWQVLSYLIQGKRLENDHQINLHRSKITAQPNIPWHWLWRISKTSRLKQRLFNQPSILGRHRMEPW